MVCETLFGKWKRKMKIVRRFHTPLHPQYNFKMAEAADQTDLDYIRELRKFINPSDNTQAGSSNFGQIREVRGGDTQLPLPCSTLPGSLSPPTRCSFVVLPTINSPSLSCCAYPHTSHTHTPLPRRHHPFSLATFPSTPTVGE